MAAGPPVGGFLVDALGWRSLFWINAPIIVAAVVLSAVFVPESRAARARRWDPPGQILLTITVCASVAVLIEGPRIGWTSPLAYLAYGAAAAAATGFVLAERRRREPLMDLGLFANPAFTTAVLGAVAVFVAFTITLLLNTLYLQHTRQWSALAAGIATLPMALATIVCAPLSGILVSRHGARRPLLLAAGFMAVGALCLIDLGNATPVAVLLLAYLLIGIGFGFANAPITNTAVAGLPPERSGVAGAITSTARQVGSAIGIAVAGGLVADRAPQSLAAASRPGWLIVAACALFLVAVARAARTAKA
jgi:MFS family permease